ncbi:TraM recognition domain-containing protein [Pseudoclavibacter chungangensis]|uniref:TraM recognition domain-containing protein n=1 Tax=Pseudoclavibacter chungangensis TaxID=587635 RepID=A0A7J5C1S6_9MICO|nr:type IV secretory system conjugative DNA transfer family protein [Pseudoclavibacter chungangensis]KAB1660385.1 TraM recognition domain-containing protein [Pseudoclavibacter chungangensis]NYJ65749.1 type IV secretory pathway TraG/TraD family ATPase VirD4 [Pseudoclavibacter chungangensis]
MERTTARKRIRTRALVIGGSVVAVAGAVAATNLVVRLGEHLSGGTQAVPADPVATVLDLVRGSIGWTGAMTLVLAGLLVVLAGLGALTLWVLRRRRARRTRVDYAARHMGRGDDVKALSRTAAAATSARLGLRGNDGLLLGETVGRREPLYAGWEDMWVVIAGPRTGKSTSVAIPSIAAAPGAVVVTSNKPDVVHATRHLRLARGRVWVFNPQRVSTDTATWWWNPLSSVVDDVSAAELAAHFANGSRQPGAQTDAFFDPAGRDLLTGLLLAAAAGGEPITRVSTWLSDPEDREPVGYLREHGWDTWAETVQGVISSPDKQRGGVYGTAQQMAACLANSHVREWITPGDPGDGRPEFDHRAFGSSTDTLYSLSREGAGSAGPIVLALTAAVAQAAERAASERASGRLAIPMVAVLDEAANVCRWGALPDLYSHFGSRGIIIQTILQSWSQGCEVWTEPGMNKLWSASNIKLYIGGVAETQFLEQLSQTIGDREFRTETVTRSQGDPSFAVQTSTDRILTVSELAALPRGRAVVVASGSRPALLRTVPWWQGDHATAIRASIAAAEQAERTAASNGMHAVGTDAQRGDHRGSDGRRPEQRSGGGTVHGDRAAAPDVVAGARTTLTERRA